jgi:hypothetical protein
MQGILAMQLQQQLVSATRLYVDQHSDETFDSTSTVLAGEALQRALPLSRFLQQSEGKVRHQSNSYPS